MTSFKKVPQTPVLNPILLFFKALTITGNPLYIYLFTYLLQVSAYIILHLLL